MGWTGRDACGPGPLRFSPPWALSRLGSGSCGFCVWRGPPLSRSVPSAPAVTIAPRLRSRACATEVPAYCDWERIGTGSHGKGSGVTSKVRYRDACRGTTGGRELPVSPRSMVVGMRNAPVNGANDALRNEFHPRKPPDAAHAKQSPAGPAHTTPHVHYPWPANIEKEELLPDRAT